MYSAYESRQENESMLGLGFDMVLTSFLRPISVCCVTRETVYISNSQFCETL